MNLTDKGLWLLERVDDLAARCPVALVRRSTMLNRQRTAFDLGVDAARVGLGRPTPPGDGRRHLHAV